VRLLQASTAATPALLEEFRRADGYGVFVQVARWLGSQAEGADMQMQLTELTAEFVHVGSADIVPQLPPAEHSDDAEARPCLFRGVVLPLIADLCLPQSRPPLDMDVLLSGMRVRNTAAFHMFQGLFAVASDDTVRAHVLDCMLQVYAMSPANYYILKELHMVSGLIDGLDRLSDEIKGRVLKMLEYVVTVVNTVPVLELRSLAGLLQGLPTASPR
jgi:hypothetical protein